MSIVGLMSLLAGAGALAAAARLVYLVLASRSDETVRMRRALVVHGVACLVLVAVELIANPLELPVLAAVPLGLMAVGWGVASVLVGLTYGPDYDIEAEPAVNRRWGRASDTTARSPAARARRLVGSVRAPR